MNLKNLIYIFYASHVFTIYDKKLNPSKLQTLADGRLQMA